MIAIKMGETVELKPFFIQVYSDKHYIIHQAVVFALSKEWVKSTVDQFFASGMVCYVNQLSCKSKFLSRNSR